LNEKGFFGNTPISTPTVIELEEETISEHRGGKKNGLDTEKSKSRPQSTEG